MTISADMVRELAARGERTTLDFKRQDYNWSANNANAELAKDLMAMANVLGPGAAPAHILIGVANDGTIVGVPPTSHVDDASLHQKVSAHLNSTPRFTYSPIDVDGRSVGVYEIMPGGRPYFPLRDASSLRKNVAMYRDGTATEPASPRMILDWDREDDPGRREQLDFDRRKRDAEAAVHGHVLVRLMSTNEDVEIELQIENTGRSGFFIEAAEWSAEWRSGFYEALGRGGGRGVLLAGYVPPHGTLAQSPAAGLIPLGSKVGASIRWTRAEALAHIKTNGLVVAGFNGRWASYHVQIKCRSDLGGEGVLRCTAE